MFNLKKQLYQMALRHVEARISSSRQTLNNAIAAGNEETKSSAGDKYETGRAMMQMEQDKFRTQLHQAQLSKNELLQIRPEKKSAQVEKGALVRTSAGTFFIAIGIGKIKLEEANYFVISHRAPIAQAMMGQVQNATVSFQDKVYQILEII